MPLQTTPFDQIIRDIQNVGSATLPMPPKEIGRKVLPHLKYLQAGYITFLRVKTEKEIHAWMESAKNMTPEERAKATRDDMEEAQKSSQIYRYTYFNFISSLNRMGRCVRETRFTIPLYQRIRFFRNVVVEHWDAYISMPPGTGSQGTFGSIPIPVIYGISRAVNQEFKRGGKLIPTMKTMVLKIKNEFNKHGKNLHDLTADYWGSEYAEKIWQALEKIDPELKSMERKFGLLKQIMHKISTRNFSLHFRKQKPYIPKKIVNLLFAYEFPLPFYDVDVYCESLVTALRNVK